MLERYPQDCGLYSQTIPMIRIHRMFSKQYMIDLITYAKCSI